MRLWLVLLTALDGLVCLAGIGAAVIAPMLFDAPGSTENTSLTLLFDVILATPLVAIGAITLTWLLALLKWERTALIPAVVPPVWAAGALVLMAWAF